MLLLTLLNNSKIANEYDQRHIHVVTQLEQYVHAKKDFIGVKEGDRLLDYACGTGMISRVGFQCMKPSHLLTLLRPWLEKLVKVLALTSPR